MGSKGARPSQNIGMGISSESAHKNHYNSTRNVCTINNERDRIIDLSGSEPHTIVIPLTEPYLQWCLKNSLPLQVALANFGGHIKIHSHSHQLYTLVQQERLEEHPK